MMDEGFVRVAKLADVPPGRMLGVQVDGEPVALYNVDGTVYATRDECTHQSYPLSKGELFGRYVKCWLHAWVFDVTTGAYQGNPCVGVRCHPVRVLEGEVWVGRAPLPRPPAPPPFVSRDDA
jgi:nitrite reductase/ring-hydroxylating ferredoxin subunit